MDFTIILAIVSQKFLMAQKMPILPYLTMLDRHFLWNISFCVMHAFVACMMRPVYEAYCPEKQWVVMGGICKPVQIVDRCCLGIGLVTFFCLHYFYYDRITARQRVLRTWRWVQEDYWADPREQHGPPGG